METGDTDATALLAALIRELGPIPFVALALIGLLIWQAPKLWRRGGEAAPAPAHSGTEDARALGRVEGLLEGIKGQIEDHDARLRALEAKRTR